MRYDKMNEKHLPVIGITMGDPCGIGPEIILKLACDGSISDKAFPLIIGDASFLERTARELNLDVTIVRISDPDEIIESSRESIHVIDLNNVPGNIKLGKSVIEGGAASVE